MTEAFAVFHAQARERVDQALIAGLDAAGALGGIEEAMHYAVMNGGKRLRPTMAYAAYFAVLKAANGEFSSQAPQLPRVDAAASALEMIHSYSLVHDDLPAMDDDDLRRGKPSCHIAFDESTAILAGDALQALAFEQMASCASLKDHQFRQLSLCLARAAGAAGMVGGQVLDISAVGQADTMSKTPESTHTGIQQMEAMHNAKTGALICASLEMGAICADAGTEVRHLLKEYGQLLGLAFQVADDILDVTGTTEQLGKQQGADQLLGKPTYPALMGLEESQRYALELCQQAQQTLNKVDAETAVLHELATYVVKRVH